MSENQLRLRIRSFYQLVHKIKLNGQLSSIKSGSASLLNPTTEASPADKVASAYSWNAADRVLSDL